MTRTQFEKVVLVGLKRSQGGTPQQQAQSIADAMELAMEMDGGSPPAPQPVPVSRPAPKPEAPAIEWPLLDAKTAVGPDGASLVQVEKGPDVPADVRHIGSRQTITLEVLLKALNERTPPVIEVTYDHPEKGRVQHMLERNVIADPEAKCARLTYKHPAAPDMLTAVVVFDTEDGPPDLAAGVQKARMMAAQLYTPREVRTVPVRDVPSEAALLSQSFGNVETIDTRANPPDMSAISGLSFKDGFNFRS